VLDAATFGELDLIGLLNGRASDVYDATEPETTASRIRDAEIVVTNKVVLDAAALREARALRLICIAATGSDNVDLSAARELGIAVANVPGYATDSVVSHSFALYFQLAHHLAYHDRYTKSGGWSQSPIFTHLEQPWSELAGKTWGIVGMGAIGRGVARVAAAFGCTVIYHSTSGTNTAQPFRRVALATLLTEADVVSIHAPLNERTRGLIGAAELATMKRRAILINVGRGGIVEEYALAEALDAGTIAAAGIDVMPTEPPPADHPLLTRRHPERLLMTPHIAGLSLEARQRLVREVRANIDAFLNGTERHRIDLT